PDVDVRVPQDARVGAHPLGLGDDPALLGARHEVIDEDPQTALRGGGEGADLGREVVHAVQHLDDDALHPQVVTPDLLHQLGVVPTLDPDPGAAGDAGTLTGD